MTILELGRIASAHDTEIAHAMLHAVAVATARGGAMVRRVGYCLSCGMLRELEGGMCRQCAADARLPRKRARRGSRPRPREGKGRG